MDQARSRCLPMNFGTKDMVGVLKNRERAREMDTGSSLADVDPMAIDTKVRKTFFIASLSHNIVYLFSNLQYCSFPDII